MKTPSTVRAAHALLLHGGATREGHVDRDILLKAAPVAVRYTSLRDAGRQIGVVQGKPGLRFFDSSKDNWLSCGPGAGVCAGVSVGATSVRSVLVDANGWEYAAKEIDAAENQLELEPDRLLARVRAAVIASLREGMSNRALLVDGQLPLLGCSVAWPTPISRDRRPVEHTLTQQARNNGPLDTRLRGALALGEIPVFVMSDAHAAAIAIARAETRGETHMEWSHPHLMIVLRIAGNVSGAVIVIEEKMPDRELGYVSGFLGSILLGGVDNQAGEIGHVPVSKETVRKLSRQRLEGARPLEAVQCSCAVTADEAPNHLEAYASVLAVTQRLYPEKKRSAALKAIARRSGSKLHAHTLADIGTLIGETMQAPVAMLNPASIVLSGSLALPPLEHAVREQLKVAHTLGSQPAIRSLSGNDNDYLRAKGAALAMLRVRVYRRLAELLNRHAVENIRGLTHPIRRGDL
jgi:predicted NBD/HSP70 family sugar kinase